MSLPRWFSLPLLFWFLLTDHAAAASRSGEDNMLPAGRWGLQFGTRITSADEKYNDEGELAPICESSDNLNLDSSIVPMLSGYPEGATLGVTDVDSDFRGRWQRLGLAYGVTPDLSMGVFVTHGRVRHRVRVDVSDSNLEMNPAFDSSQPMSDTNPPFLPLGTATGEPIDSDDIDEILTNPVYGYEYEPVGTVRRTAWVDPTLGLRWRFLHTARMSGLMTTQLRFGQGAQTDPDNLFDVWVSDGSRDWVQQFRINHRVARNVRLKYQLGFEVQFPDEVKARALSEDEEIAPVSRKETVDRDLGDSAALTLGASYRTGSFRFLADLKYRKKQADDYDSPTGQDVTGLEDETAREQELAYLAVKWNGVRAWRQGLAPMPMRLTLIRRQTLGGRNVLDTDDWYLVATLFF